MRVTGTVDLSITDIITPPPPPSNIPLHWDYQVPHLLLQGKNMTSLNILTTCISLFILLHAFCIAYWYPGSLSKFGSVDNSGNDIHQTVTLTCHISTHLIWNCPIEQYIYFRLDPWKFRFLQTYPPSPFLKIKREVLQREVCNPTTVRCIHWQPIITRLTNS